MSVISPKLNCCLNFELHNYENRKLILSKLV
jgi:hypothetical protein